jgi:tRNA G18 (ribose-2'-O)-methylase SpoU
MNKNLEDKQIFVIANDIRSLINVGTIFRICDGIAVKKLFLCGLTGYPKKDNDPRRFEVQNRADEVIKKTALEGYSSVNWEYQENILDLIKNLKSQGVQIVTLELTPNSIDYTKADYRFPLAIVIGHETDGVSQDVINLSDISVQIPMLGKGKSLNVATSLGILGYKIRES